MIGNTVTGKQFEYEGSLSDGLVVRTTASVVRITPDTVRIIRNEIAQRSPVLMGANRVDLVKDSVGETLAREHGISAQQMSSVLPLLVMEGYCAATKQGRGFVLRKI